MALLILCAAIPWHQMQSSVLVVGGCITKIYKKGKKMHMCLIYEKNKGEMNFLGGNSFWL